MLEVINIAGVSPDREVVSYCDSGVAAANNYLTLRNLGYQNVVLYDAFRWSVVGNIERQPLGEESSNDRNRVEAV